MFPERGKPHKAKVSEYMIVRKFMAWLETADSARRCKGAGALARVYLQDELTDEEILEAETALTALLDDPVINVRRAMAREFAYSANAPAHIVAALAADHSSVSSRLLTYSPLLNDEDLIDCLAVADPFAQVSIAIRPGLSRHVTARLAETASREALVALAVNESADLDEAVMQQMIQRHGANGEVREALLSRASLPPCIRATLASATANALQVFVTKTGWLSAERSERTSREARDAATIDIAAQLRAETGAAPIALARQLRQNNQLTPALLLRTLVSGDRALFVASLCVLTAMPEGRINNLVKAWSGAGFGALYAKANLPAGILAAFRAALAAQDATGLIYAEGQIPKLSTALIDHTLKACHAAGSPELRTAKALLLRLRSEAARVQARIDSSELIASTKAPPALPAPQIDLEIDLEAIEAEVTATVPAIAA